MANMSNSRHIGAERVDFLPVPPRSVAGIMSFNPTQGVGLFESLANRALLALPLLAIGIWGSWWTTGSLINTPMQPGVVNRQLDSMNHSFAPAQGRNLSAESWSDPLNNGGTKLVDQDHLGWLLVNFVPVYLIWLMEANRRANYLKPIQLYVYAIQNAQTEGLTC